MSIRPLQGALLCAFLVIATNAVAQQYTVRDMVDDPTYSAPRISPNGEYLAMKAPVNGRDRLVIIDVKSMKIAQTASFGARTASSGDDEVGDFWWASPDRIVFTRNTKTGFLDGSLYTCEIYAMGADGSKRAEIWGSQVGSFSCGYVTDTLLDDDKFIMIEGSAGGSGTNFGKPSIYKTDIYSGETRNVGTSPADNGSLDTDRNGKPRLALGFNDKTFKQQLFWRHEDKLDWIDLSDLIQGDEGAYTAGFAPNNQDFYVVTDDKDSSTDVLYLIDPLKRTKTRVFNDPAVDIDRIMRDQENRIYAVQTQPNFPERKYIDPKSLLSRLTASLEPAFPDQMINVNSISRDEKLATVFVWSDQNPGEVYLLDVATMKPRFAFSVYPRLNPKDMALRDPVKFKTRDGVEINAYLTLPQGKSKNLPLIVLPHGGPHGPRDDWGFDPEAQLLANHGYAVLQVNYRGSGGYGKKFERSGYKLWGTTMQDDLTDATLWAVAQGYADRQRLCIYGGSYGGYAALMGVEREPDLYKCAVGYAGVYDLQLMYRSGDVQRSGWGEDYLHKALGTDAADLAARSPVTGVARIKADLFLAHGERDQRAHFDHYKALTKALDGIGKKYESLVKPKEGHGFADVENRVEFYTQMLNFFQRNIGGSDTRAPLPDNPPPAKQP